MHPRRKVVRDDGTRLRLLRYSRSWLGRNTLGPIDRCPSSTLDTLRDHAADRTAYTLDRTPGSTSGTPHSARWWRFLAFLQCPGWPGAKSCRACRRCSPGLVNDGAEATDVGRGFKQTTGERQDTNGDILHPAGNSSDTAKDAATLRRQGRLRRNDGSGRRRWSTRRRSQYRSRLHSERRNTARRLSLRVLGYRNCQRWIRRRRRRRTRPWRHCRTGWRYDRCRSRNH